MPQDPGLCHLYDTLLVEDEFLMDKWKGSPPSCRVHPLDPHEVMAPVALGPIPWQPGGKIPFIHKALVSFHAYTVYEEEAQTNPQRWLTDPDTWNPYFVEAAREGFLRLCLKKEDCNGDDAPFRLMFWEDISKEFVDCMARGITPVYFGTPAVHEYVERNVVLVPWRFQSPLEMQLLLQTLSSPEGVLEHGTRVYMTRQSNHILSSLYWRQSVLLRALLTANAAQKQRPLLAFAASAASSGASPGSLQGSLAVAELVVCVASAAENRHLREIVRQTWGRDQLLHTFAGKVRLRVMFFLADTPEAREEAAQGSDVVLLPLEEAFASIWLKTAAILKFGSDYFQGKLRAQGDKPYSSRVLLRFLVKCDDDAFIDIDALALDLVQASPVGLYWGHVMALVEPNRIVGDKYFVPKEVYPFEYYPPYARGMAYALSEDLVAPLGAALGEDRVEPFPYREDVSVGLYLHELSQLGEVRVVPRQRKDAMPLDFNEHCSGGGQPPIGTPAPASPVTATGGAGRTLLVLHRFTPSDAPCLWEKIEARRRAATWSPPDFCSCARRART